MNKVVYYRLNEVSSIEDGWKDLESGSEMTYFQSFEWYRSICPRIPSDCKEYESRFVTLYEDDKVKAIAPIWVIKRTFNIINKKGIYLLGHGGWSDYLNFIYKDVTEQEIVFLIEDIAKHYGTSLFCFDDVPELSILYQIINRKYLIRVNEVTPCVELRLPKSIDEYRDVIGKSFKQNLRTAVNRLSKAGFEITFCFDDLSVDKLRCEELREVRLPRKQGRYGLIRKLKIAIVRLLHFSFSFDLPFYSDVSSHIMTARINDNLAAFFNYGLDKHHKRVVLMAVGTSEQYGWYSPGILLMYEFIRLQIDNPLVEVIDFTRGNEKYKYSFGGKDHFNHRVIFNI